MAAVRRPLHKTAHSLCQHANWSACDKAADNAKADWDAMQQVILAYNLVVRAGGETPKEFRKGKGLFEQLVQLIGGAREELVNDDGNPHQGPWPTRIRAAITRFKAGDLPTYNLYEPVAPAQQ